MWKQFLDLFRQLLLLSENTKRQQQDLANLQKKTADLSDSTAQNFQRVDITIERLYTKSRDCKTSCDTPASAKPMPVCAKLTRAIGCVWK